MVRLMTSSLTNYEIAPKPGTEPGRANTTTFVINSTHLKLPFAKELITPMVQQLARN